MRRETLLKTPWIVLVKAGSSAEKTIIEHTGQITPVFLSRKILTR